MQKTYLRIVFLLLSASISSALFSQNIAINTSGSTGVASAILDLNTGNTFTGSNGKGLLIPNVALSSATDASTIASPAYSLLVYNTGAGGLSPAGYYYNANSMGGSATWTELAIGGMNWLVTGNTGTADNTNYLGTNDNVPLTFKIYGKSSGRIDKGLANTFLGYEAGDSTTVTGSNNTAIGYEALTKNISGVSNTAVGYTALSVNTTGKDNTGIGGNALNSSTIGMDNTAVGYNALQDITTASGNVAVGVYAGYDNNGNQNVFIGDSAGNKNSSGIRNVYEGFAAGTLNTSGSSNTAVGYWAGYNNVSDYNVFIGDSAGATNTSGTENTAVGYQAFANSKIHPGNTAVGYQALYANFSDDNTAVGANSLNSATTGYHNTALGYNTLQALVTGSSNLGIGYAAGYNNTGNQNVFVGDSAGYKNTSGNNNVFIGYTAGASNTTGSNQVYIGDSTTVTSVKLPNAAIMIYYGGAYNAGTTGQVLASQGNGMAPQWLTAATGADNGLSVNGTNVELGGLTSSPATLLHNSVVSESGYRMDFDLGTYTAKGTGTFVISNGGIGNAEYLNVSNSGNTNHQGHVGIGTSSPQALLDVEGNNYTAASGANGDSIVLVAQNASGGNANGGNVVLTPGTGNGNGTNGNVEVSNLNITNSGVVGNKPVYADNNGNLNVRTPPYFTHVHTITTSSSYTVPAGATRIKVYLVGGGGGGNNYNMNSTCNSCAENTIQGGGGGYVYGELETSPGELLSITIGAGGSGNSTSAGGVAGGGGGTYIERGSTLLCGAGGGGGASGWNENHNGDSNYIGLAGGQSFGNTVASLAGPAGLTGYAYGTPSGNYTGYLENADAFAGIGAISSNSQAAANAGASPGNSGSIYSIGLMPQNITGIGGNTSYGLPDEWSYYNGLSGVVVIYY